jgi:ABC-2 type transport system ATP-binding protein
MGEEIILEVKNLSKSFGRKKILKDISFSIKKGNIIGLIGKSGEGKTVLIKTIIGFLHQNSGKIILKNILKKDIGFSMQDNSLYENLTLKQNWKYFGKLFGLKRSQRKEKINYLLGELSLIEFKKIFVKNLSGGTKKRVDIGCSLLNSPKILILDEPFAGLDPELANQLSRFILQLNKQGVTIIISSHRISELSRISTQIFLLKDKKIKEIEKNEIMNIYQ